MIKYFDFLWAHCSDCILVFYVADAGHIVLKHANPVGQRLLRKPAESCLEQELRGLFDPPQAETLAAACIDCVQSGETSRYRLTIRTDGNVSYWEADLTSVEKLHTHADDKNTVILWAKDVTKIVQLTKQQATLLQEYNSLFTSTSSGMGLIRRERDGRLKAERSNHTFEEIWTLIQQCGGEEKARREFQTMLAERRSTSGQFHIDMDGKQTRFYNYDLVFFQNANGVDKVFLTMVNATEAVRFGKRAEVQLTARELEVLHHVAAGDTNRAIACKLGIAEGTVKKTLYNIYRKLHIQSRAEAVKYMLSERKKPL